MKIDADVLLPEDVHTMNTKDRFIKKLDYDDIELAKEVPIVVRYDYIDLKDTAYHFKQEFTHDDTIGYFSRMKEFSGKSVQTLLDAIDPKTKRNKYHFYKNTPRGQLLYSLKICLPHADVSNLIVFHFALYDTTTRADRKAGTRNSRVYFVLGTYGHIYILFFDPYHELNPDKKTV